MTNGSRAEFAEVLARVPLFRSFNGPEIERLAELCGEVRLQKGETVCRAGDEGDRLFILASGELEVWGEGPRLINRLRPGEPFGELSLLLGGKRNATVTAARAARLLVIDKASFDRFFLQSPKVLEHLSRHLAGRLAGMARGEAVIARTTTIAVTAGPALRGKTLVAHALAAVLRRLIGDEVLLVHFVGAGDGRRTRTPLLAALAEAGLARLDAEVARRGGPLAPELAVAARALDDRSRLTEALAELVAKLSERFPMIVFDPGVADAPLARAVLSVSDRVVEIVDRWQADVPGGASAARTLQVVNLANPGSEPIPVSHCEPFVLPFDPALAPLDAPARALYLRDEPRSPSGRPIHRLARKLLGSSVGVALGGGAAFGISHIGVLRALEENDIPVDLVAGTSMGAVIGAGYASGFRPAEMVDLALRLGTWWTTLSLALDPAIVRPGLLSGDRVAKVFRSIAGRARTFSDLVLPFRAVAADVETGERVSIGSGSIELAYRASTAVPVMWSPIRIDGRILIDGSMIDPVPGEVVREMGGDVCIAVNVVPPLRRGVKTVLARWHERLSRFNPLAYLGRSQGMPSLFDIGMNTIQMLQRELGSYKAIGADLVISPDLTEFTWIELYRAPELIERGVAAAERALPDIRRLLAERLAAARRPRTRTGALEAATVTGVAASAPDGPNGPRLAGVEPGHAAGARGIRPGSTG